ncbi:MAG TPA: amidohydrolase family protein [Methylomirabilota bacterium]|jgi:predicted TIM-barrel fold metal-dependent hydrolase
MAGRLIDCHAHIIDPARFPLPGGPGYKPRPEETGTREAYGAMLDELGAPHALLVQPSGYGVDNRAMLDAMKASPGRFKGIAMVDPGASDRTLEALLEAGVVGVRFNLPSYDPDALGHPEAPALLERLRALGLFAQVYAHDAQWAAIAPVLRKSRVRVLVDHFGAHDLAGGVDQPGFRAVLALGREGQASVKLSAAYRLSRKPGYEDLEPFAEAILGAFGTGSCMWGSDWPFLGVSARPDLAPSFTALRRWLPDSRDRQRILWDNPFRLFRFGD